MRIAICDDESHFRSTLKQKLKAYSSKNAVSITYDDFENGDSFLNSDAEYDIVFLDYEMGVPNGMDTARRFRLRNSEAVIIFVTNHHHIVFESFEVDTFRFLTKPIEDEKLFKAIDDYIAQSNECRYLIINRPNIVRIKLDDIIYVEATGKSCIIHTTLEKINYAKVMAEVERHLPKDRFFKSHKSFIVGLKHVKGRFGNDILFDNNDRAFLAAAKTAAFKEVFVSYLKRYVFNTDSLPGQ